jgi:long-subunit fatty acid transport protein
MLPTTSEQDQGVVSLGAEYTHDIHRVDLSYSLGLFSGRKVDDSLNPAFNGDYDFEAHLVSISYGRTF